MNVSAILRPAALVAVAATLVADSAEPVCASYAGFDLSFQYVLDCGAGDTGTLDVSMRSRQGTDIQPQPSDVDVSQSSGNATFTVSYLDFDSSSCTDDGTGRGTLGILSFLVTLGADTGDLRDYDCSGWDASKGDQTLDCNPSSKTGGKACSLTLSEVDVRR
jgi:hypothetical protein